MERILATNPVLDSMRGSIMWPGWQVGGQTMNQARGFGQKATIADRLTLTVECIRVAYLGIAEQTVNSLGSTRRLLHCNTLGGQGRGRTADLPIFRPSPSKKPHPEIVGIQRFSRTQTH